MSQEVVVHDAAGFQRRQVLPAGPISVGRSPDCVIQLESNEVSRRHALIWVSPSSLRVEDQSRNGTLAGEELLVGRSAEVPIGTPIVVANFALLFEPPGAEIEPA